jgi:anti-sigma factor RsiW
MMMTDGGVLGVVEVELLLPWFVSGKLSRAEAGAVECAIARSPELARRLDMVRREQVETVLLNDGLPPPSARPIKKLMSAIEAEGAPGRHARR